MKKILFLNHNIQGVGTYLRCIQLAREIKHSITIICINKDQSNWIVKTEIDKVKIILLPNFSPKFLCLVFDIILSTYYCLTLKYDILHSFSIAQPLVLFPTLVIKIFRRNFKFIVDWDDYYSGGVENIPQIMAKMMATSETTFPKHADVITCASHNLYLLAKKMYPHKKVVYITNGVSDRFINHKTLAPLNKTKPIVITTMANVFVECESTEAIFKITTILSKKLKRRFFVNIISKFDDKLKKKYLSLYPNCQKYIQFSQLSYTDTLEILYQSDLFILPMANISFDFYRSPIRFGSFLVSFKPIISNAVGEVKYLIDKYHLGLTSPPSNIILFTDNIIKLINDPKLYYRISQNVSESSKHISCSQLADKLLKQAYL